MTLPYHPLLNLVWLPFAWMYLAANPGRDPLREAVLRLAQTIGFKEKNFLGE